MKMKYLLLIVIALSLVLFLILAGCAKEPTTQEIIDKAAAANVKLETYKVDMDMSMTLSGTVEGKAQNVAVQMNSTSIMDNTHKQMQMDTDIEMEMTGQGKISMPMESYLMGDWMYMKISLPLVGGQWMKVKTDQHSWSNQSQTGQFSEMLKNSIKVTDKGTESINGKACYVLEASPDTASITSWFKSQQGLSNLQNMDIENLDFSKIIKSMSLKQWIAKDNYYFIKTEISVKFEINGQDLGINSKSSDQIVMGLSGILNYYDHNKPVTITLPAEAASAKETKSP